MLRLSAQLSRYAIAASGAGDTTATEAKHLDSRQDAGDERVVMWNTVTQRKCAGNSAPRRAHLQQYLQDHPEYEVYTGQNQSKGGSLQPASNGSRSTQPAPKSTSSTEEEGRTMWSALEDAELARLVRENGPGNWKTKAAVFTTGRTASAMRMRWCKLEEEAEQFDTTAGEMRIKVWNRSTQRIAAGNSAPRRENLERFLEEHP